MEKATVKWRRELACSNNACVEVAKVDGTYLIRDAKDPEGAVLSFSEQEWKAFAAAWRPASSAGDPCTIRQPRRWRSRPGPSGAY